jgi:hypothetical protein
MLELFKRAASGVASAATGKVRLFVDIDGLPYVKDETGVVASLKGEVGPQGEQGIQGPQGEPGSDAEVTSENIIAALGYTPADEAVLGDIQAALDAINGV